ncbi:MAG: hypothetical protein LBL79_03430 [Prevotella sp.]|jgi:hypothetical protein|nr:hypothetical protein [Prevotella sp.]
MGNNIIENSETYASLTDREVVFCELFVNGCAPYCGNAAKCYEEAFNVSSTTSTGKAKKLLAQKHIRDYIEDLESLSYEEAKHLKKRLTENLLHIIEETSKAEYMDRRGTKLSPAPLRSVAVQATKALMDMHPIKEANINKLNIEGTGEGGVVFNVILPAPDKQKKETDG